MSCAPNLPGERAFFSYEWGSVASRWRRCQGNTLTSHKITNSITPTIERKLSIRDEGLSNRHDLRAEPVHEAVF